MLLKIINLRDIYIILLPFSVNHCHWYYRKDPNCTNDCVRENCFCCCNAFASFSLLEMRNYLKNSEIRKLRKTKFYKNFILFNKVYKILTFLNSPRESVTSFAITYLCRKITVFKSLSFIFAKVCIVTFKRMYLSRLQCNAFVNDSRWEFAYIPKHLWNYNTFNIFNNRCTMVLPNNGRNSFINIAGYSTRYCNCIVE